MPPASAIRAILNVDGNLLLPGEESISAFDRSYLYGDSLYEVIRTYDGIFLDSQMQAHLERLQASARLCRMVELPSNEVFLRECQRALEFFHAQSFGSENGKPRDAYCRIVVSRGMGKIGFALSQLLTPARFTIIVQPVDTPSEEAHEKGLNLHVVDRIRNDRRALDPAMKSGNYLNNLLAFLEAAELGAEDALLVDAEGNLTEGTTFNLFYARRGILCTPPLEVGILEGITRRTVIALARRSGMEVREVRFPRERLLEADEVFATSTLKEVMAVTRIDGKKISNGKPGKITRFLRNAFQGEIRGEVKSNRGAGHS